MLRPIAAALALLGVLAPALARSEGIICAAEEGPLLLVGREGAGAGPGRVLELEHWKICFTCAGLPHLWLTMTDKETGQEAAVSVGVRSCGSHEAALPERYCFSDANVRVGNREGRWCRFPERTTLGRLWTVPTGAAPPEARNGWWVYPDR